FFVLCLFPVVRRRPPLSPLFPYTTLFRSSFKFIARSSSTLASSCHFLSSSSNTLRTIGWRTLNFSPYLFPLVISSKSRIIHQNEFSLYVSISASCGAIECFPYEPAFDRIGLIGPASG